MYKMFNELPEMPTFDRWVKAYFRYIELVVVCAGLAVVAKKTASWWLRIPASVAILCLIFWTFFGVLREIAKTANAKAPRPGTWQIFTALVCTALALGWAYEGTLEMFTALANFGFKSTGCGG